MQQKDFRFPIPKNLFRIIQRLQKSNYRVVIVGGALRDFRLGNKVSEYDLASNARPEDIQKLFRRSLPTGLQHGTVTVMQGNSSYEITTFRHDGIYKNGRCPENVTFTGDLLGDLARRDFSINALAFEPNDLCSLQCEGANRAVSGILFDLHNGLHDLKQGQIRAIGMATTRFKEDALRMLRACRFSAKLGFQIEPKTLDAIQRLASNLQQVSQPRIEDELRQLLCAPFAPQGLAYLLELGLSPQLVPQLSAHSLALFSTVWQVWVDDYHTAESWPSQLNQMAAKLGISDNPLLCWHREKFPLFSFVWAFLCLANHTKHDNSSLSPNPTLLIQDIERLFQGQRPQLSTTKHATLVDNGGLERMLYSNKEKKAIMRFLQFGPVLWGPSFLNMLYSQAHTYPIQAYIRGLLHLLSRDFVAPALRLLGFSCQVSQAPPQLWQRFCSDILHVIQQEPALSIRELAIDGRALMADCRIQPDKNMGRLLQKLLGHVLLYPQDNQTQALKQLAQTIDK